MDVEDSNEEDSGEEDLNEKDAGEENSFANNSEMKCEMGGYYMEQHSLQNRKFSSIWLLRGILLVAAVAMIIAGVANGETHTVLQKAVNICLECIGIG